MVHRWAVAWRWQWRSRPRAAKSCAGDSELDGRYLKKEFPTNVSLSQATLRACGGRTGSLKSNEDIRGPNIRCNVPAVSHCGSPGPKTCAFKKHSNRPTRVWMQMWRC